MKSLFVKAIFFLLLIPAFCFAQPIDNITSPSIEITELDASPSTFPYKLNFPNGSITDNGDSTASIDFVGGSLPTTYLKLDCSNDPLTNTLDGANLDFSGTGSFGTLDLGSGSITDTSGAISFGNENLLTSGTLGAGAITGTSFAIGANLINSFANLDSLADLAFTSTSFVKMSGANTFSLDTATYEPTLTKGNLTATSPIALDQTRQVIGGAAVISHATTDGNIHLPSGGTVNQILKNSGTAGTGSWGTVTENAGALAAITTLSMSNQLTNTLAIGTKPLVITSTTMCDNLNADLLDGQHLAALALVGQTMYIGTTGVAINRASAALTLAGITLTTPDIGAAVFTSLTASGDTNLYRKAANILATDDILAITSTATATYRFLRYSADAASASTWVLSTQEDSDANARFYMIGTGKMFWGAGGATAVDTNLYRSAANVLKTDDTLNIDTLTASQAVFTDASKNLVSNAITGSGNVVMSTSPTLVTPTLGVATGTRLGLGQAADAANILSITQAGSVGDIALVVTDTALGTDEFMIKKVSASGYRIMGRGFNTIAAADADGFGLTTSANAAQWLNAKGVFLGSSYTSATAAAGEVITAVGQAFVARAGANAAGSFRGGDSNTESTTSGGVGLRSGTAFATGTGGAGGTVTILGVSAGGDGTVARAGGTVAITAGSAKGANAGAAMTLDAGDAGARPETGTNIAQAGGAITARTGDGGTAPNSQVASTGGVAGTNLLVGGSGGAAAVAGTGTNTGGTGGSVQTLGGTGGIASGATSGINTGGNGGTATVTGGTGATATTGSGTLTPGNGGTVTISGGASAAQSGSAGGAVIVRGTVGTSTGTGGIGGGLTLSGGAAGGDGTVARTGGAVSVTAGNAKGDVAGAAMVLDAGNAGITPGAGTVTAKAGGAITITTGDGGTATAADVLSTGGIAGTNSLIGGLGGAAAQTTGNNTGGLGGRPRITGGAGGAASGATLGANLGGVGGDIVLTSGTGGAATLGGTNTGGAGGAMQLLCGLGGAGATAAGVGGAFQISVAATTARTMRQYIPAAGGVGFGVAFDTLAPYGNQGVDVRSSTGGYLTLSRNDTAVTAADVIGEINFWTNDTSTTSNPVAAQIKTTAQNTIATDINPGDMVFSVTGTGVAGALLTHMEFKPAAAAQIGFFGAAPVVQQLAVTDLGVLLSNLGLRVAGTAYPITTSGAAAFTGGVSVNTVALSTNMDLTFTAAAKGVLLKRGANGKCGTFVANGVTPVTISNTSIAITDTIIISLNTVGGTVGVQPHVATITAGVGFTVVCTALDTSTYNYAIISNAA